MARQARLEYPGALYHLTARGIERRAIFRDDEDRKTYLERLREIPERFDARLYAYCLMPNHVHLALQTGRVPLSRIVGSLHTAYAGHFNRRHRRVGPLFQGRYKAFVVDKESYLLSLVRYIHLNPVRARLVERPEAFVWSSHALYLRGTPPWLAAGEVLGVLGGSLAISRARFREFVAGTSDAAYEEAEAQLDAVVGSEDFTRRALGKGGREDLVVRTLSIEGVARELAAGAGVSMSDLAGPGRARELTRVRALCGLLMRDVAMTPVARVARFFRRDPSTLSRDVAYLERRLLRDAAARGEMETVKAEIVARLRHQ